MKRWLAFAFVFLFITSACFCIAEVVSGQVDEGGVGQTRANGIANWTVMVYMSGDSSLSDKVAEDIDEMALVGSDDSLQIVALADRNEIGDSLFFHITESGPEEYAPNHVDPLWGTELNMGQPDILSTFVIWAVANYPAQHYMLDLWGHGIGWEGVCLDKGDYLDAVEVKTALDDISNSGIDIDIFSMDACQMGMLEMLYQVRDTVDFSIASEKDIPLAGWPYNKVLQLIKDEPGISPVDFGQKFVDEYVLWSVAYSGYSATLSLIDNSMLADVAEALDDYANELALDVGYFHPDFKWARTITEEYDGANQYDIVHLAKNVALVTKMNYLAGLGYALQEAINSAVVYEKHWTRIDDEPADNATGMSIWFPAHYPYLKYRELDICQDTFWDEFLIAYSGYAHVSDRSEIPVVAEAHSIDSDGDGLNDTLAVSAGSPTETEIRVLNSGGDLMHSQVWAHYASTNLTIPLIEPGFYSAEICLRADNGTLLNFTRIVNNLNIEHIFTISGSVELNTGKGLGWVKVTVEDAGNEYLKSMSTSSDGSFEFQLLAPWETDGLNVTVVCHHRTYPSEEIIHVLGTGEEVIFGIPDAFWITLPLLYLAVGLDALAVALILFYVGKVRAHQS